MNQEQAVIILVQAVNLAQDKGVFSLQEASVVAQAVASFIPSAETEKKNTLELNSDDKSEKENG